MVITDSQVFDRADANTPSDIWLTSFSILFARYKGNLLQAAAGAAALDSLPDAENVIYMAGKKFARTAMNTPPGR